MGVIYRFDCTTTTTFLLFSLHRHHIYIVFTPPSPPRIYCFHSTTTITTTLYCFHSTTTPATDTFLLFSFPLHHFHYRHHHISIVFSPLPPPLPHFDCFHSTTTAATFLLFSLHHHRHHASTDSLETKVNRDETSLSKKVVKNRKVRGELKTR